MPNSAFASCNESASRREFLARAASLASASLLALPCPAAAEPPPEIRTIRFNYFPAICLFQTLQNIQESGFAHTIFSNNSNSFSFFEYVVKSF